MIRITRPAAAGALAAVLLPGALLLTTQPADAETLPRPSKAQVEHLERPQSDATRAKAQIEHDEQQLSHWKAYADHMERVWRESQQPPTAQFEHAEMRPEPQPNPPAEEPIGDSGDGMTSSWQLALSALVGAAAAGGVAAGVRNRGRQQPRAAR